MDYSGVLFMIHNPFDKKFRGIRQSANVIVLTNNSRNLRHAQALSRESFCYQSNLLYKILYKLCSISGYDQLLINLQNEHPYDLVTQSGAFHPNLRQVYQYDADNREGFKTGRLMMNGRHLNTTITNQIHNNQAQDYSNLNKSEPPNTLNNTIEPTETKSLQNNETKTSGLDVSKVIGNKNSPAKEIYPGVAMSPDLLRNMDKTKDNKMETSAKETQTMNRSIQNDPVEEMSIDYSNASKRAVVPETQWMDDLTQSDSNSSNAGATRGSINEPYLSLDENQSSAMATAGTNTPPLAKQSVSLGRTKSTLTPHNADLTSVHDSKHDTKNNNTKEDFTRFLSETIINKPFDTTVTDSEPSSDSLMADIQGANAKSLITKKPKESSEPKEADIQVANAKSRITKEPHKSDEPKEKDIFDETTRSVQWLKSPSIYDVKHTRDDSYIPNWRNRKDVSGSLPPFNALFQPRFYGTPKPGEKIDKKQRFISYF